jgi:hypothetical protein
MRCSQIRKIELMTCEHRQAMFWFRNQDGINNQATAKRILCQSGDPNISSDLGIAIFWKQVSGAWPVVWNVLVIHKMFFGSAGKGGPAKNLYTKSERLTVSCRVTWAGPKGLLYDVQIIKLSKKTVTYATKSGPRPPSGPSGPGNLYMLPLLTLVGTSGSYTGQTAAGFLSAGEFGTKAQIKSHCY